MKYTLYRTIVWSCQEDILLDACPGEPGEPADKEWAAVEVWSRRARKDAEDSCINLESHEIIEVELVEFDDGTFYVESDEHMFMGMWK